MATLNERIRELEQELEALRSKIQDLSQNTEETYKKPISIVGGSKSTSLTRPVDVKTGRSGQLAGYVVFNDSELKSPAIDEEPTEPTKGYNKHSHSRYAGGALIKDVLEIVEYDWGSITNKHSQQFWSIQPNIAKAQKSGINGEWVDKIGLLDLTFNADTGTWGVAALEIDIKKCYFVERDSNGNIVTDSKGQEKRSPLYNEDTAKTSIVWDENGNCWRLHAVYAPGEE